MAPAALGAVALAVASHPRMAPVLVATRRTGDAAATGHVWAAVSTSVWAKPAATAAATAATDADGGDGAAEAPRARCWTGSLLCG